MDSPIQSSQSISDNSFVVRQNFRLKVYAVFLILLAIVLTGVVVMLVNQNQQYVTESLITTDNSVVEEDMNTEDTLPADEDETDNEVPATSSSFSSALLNFDMSFDSDYGVASSQVTENPLCTKEIVSFDSNPNAEVTLYEDMFLGAETCLPASGGTVLDTYNYVDASGNSYDVRVFDNQFGNIYAIAISILNEDTPKYEISVVVENGTQESVTAEVNALIETISYTVGLR